MHAQAPLRQREAEDLAGCVSYHFICDSVGKFSCEDLIWVRSKWSCLFRFFEM